MMENITGHNIMHGICGTFANLGKAYVWSRGKRPVFTSENTQINSSRSELFE